MGQNEDQENDFEEILEPGPDCCIYRVPQHLRQINEKAYTPKLISIGPLHYGRKELMGMENQKRRYWSTFGDHVNADKLNEFKVYIENQEQHIRAHYSVTSKLRSSDYVTMVLYDAIFIIELFWRKYHNTDDFLLKSPLGVYIEEDLLLLENQLPYVVLNDLYTIAFPNNEENQSLFVLFLNYVAVNNVLSLGAHARSQGKHFTDFYRLSLCLSVTMLQLEDTRPTTGSNQGAILNFPCATKLKESGLKFRSIEDKPLLDISLKKRRQYGGWFPWFEVNELQIPAIVIDDGTEGLFRNLMAFEMFHHPKKTPICDYADFMDQLIDSEKDVDLLAEKGIIVNAVGDNEAISKMFNKLVLQITVSDQSCYNDTAAKINAHYKYPWNHARATLKRVYFGDPWTGYATVAAVLLLILTLIQTVCSIMQVLWGNSIDNWWD